MVAPGWRAWRTIHRRARPMSLAEARAAGPWLVLAPHPDDEVLGAGSLLAVLSAAGERPHLAFLTDGSGSHPGSPGWSERRLAGARHGEGVRAARSLGLARAPIWLGWADARPHRPASVGWRCTARRLGAYLRRYRVRRLVTSWGGEGHCDHGAAAYLAEAAAHASRSPVAVHSVAVWGWTDPKLAQRTRPQPVRAVPVAEGRPAARRALLQHRSQLGTRLHDSPDAFRLPRAMWRLTERPQLLLFEGSGAGAA